MDTLQDSSTNSVPATTNRKKKKITKLLMVMSTNKKGSVSQFKFNLMLPSEPRHINCQTYWKQSSL